MHLVGNLEQWWEHGERVALRLGDTDHIVFTRAEGAGQSMTLLHGFPSSSHDWAKLAPRLSAGHSLLMPDFLGFGASEKPTEHRYSLLEQADLVEAVWARAGVGSTRIVAHDYAVSVAQELLARQAEGALSVAIEGIHFMNGGIYPELHRPQPLQLALLDPQQGPQISAVINGELFTAGLGPTFAPGFDARSDSAEIWRATSRDGGEGISHLLIRYISDREENGDRWIADSWTIANYLEDTYPERPSLFGGTAGRALSRFYSILADEWRASNGDSEASQERLTSRR